MYCKGLPYWPSKCRESARRAHRATILGHANLRTVIKYCHPQATHTAKAMEKFIGAQLVPGR
jgi:hypothetical protein